MMHTVRADERMGLARSPPRELPLERSAEHRLARPAAPVVPIGLLELGQLCLVGGDDEEAHAAHLVGRLLAPAHPDRHRDDGEALRPHRQ